MYSTEQGTCTAGIFMQVTMVTGLRVPTWEYAIRIMADVIHRLCVEKIMASIFLYQNYTYLAHPYLLCNPSLTDISYLNQIKAITKRHSSLAWVTL